MVIVRPVDRDAEQVVGRRQGQPVGVEQEGHVFGVRVGVAHDEVEDQPAEQLVAAHRGLACGVQRAVGLGEGDAALGLVLVAGPRVEELAEVDLVQPLDPVAVDTAVEALHHVERLGQVQQPGARRGEPDLAGHAGAEVLVGRAEGEELRARVVGLDHQR